MGQDGPGGDLGVAPAEGGDELAVDLFAAFALVRVGVEAAEADADIVWEVPGIKIVKLSGTSTAIIPDGPYACREHWEIEQVLAGSDQPYVILRPNAFMQTLIDQIMFPAVRASRAIPNAIGMAGISLVPAVREAYQRRAAGGGAG